MSERNPRKILVVDDEEIIRDTIRIHLEREGYGVLTSEDGKDAIKTLFNQLLEFFPKRAITK